MHRFELVIFDVDGTLLNTTEGVLASVEYTIKHFGYHELTDEQLRKFIGPPIQRSFADAYGLEGPILQDIATVFRNQYKSVDLLKAEPYDGIYDVLTGLRNRGIHTAIATYKREDYALTLMQHFKFDEYTDIIHGADHENKLKKSDIIEMCIRESGVSKDKVLMVGDTDNDAEGAEGIGVDFLAVTFGFGYEPGEVITNHPCIGSVDKAIQILDVIDKVEN
ncbi:MAG: HAD hydrolase-like protein [Catonella sp.]|nr:HAD hydrolase-like protein [Catonella sp.]MDY6357572.1 HAD hydrolase-like protein [Catonella sp.]